MGRQTSGSIEKPGEEARAFLLANADASSADAGGEVRSGASWPNEPHPVASQLTINYVRSAVGVLLAAVNHGQ
jgi:hypothetical protein